VFRFAPPAISECSIGFALILMEAETLDKIDAARGRLGEGHVRRLFECGDEIV
jgi:hypothetical protein